MAGAVLVLADSAWTRRARAAACSFWLGLGSMAVVLDSKWAPDLADRLVAAPPPPHFLSIAVGLIVPGLLLAPVAAVIILRRSPLNHQRAGAMLSLLLSAVTIVALWPLFRSVPWVESLAAAAVIVIVATLLAWLGRTLRLGQRIRATDRWFGAPAGDSAAPISRSPVGPRMVLLVGFVLALIPTVPTLVVGTIATAIILHHGSRLRGELGRVPLLPILCLSLLPMSWLILTVTGSLAPPLWSLADAPFSPAAELWIAPWLLVAAWGLLALWPIHWLVPRPLGAALAGMLLVGIGDYGVPLGMQAFLSWLAPVILLALGWAAAIGRTEMLLGGLGLFGALAVPESRAGLLLLPFGLVSVLVLTSDRLDVPKDIVLKLGLSLAGTGFWIALLAGLRSQVVYTVLCVAVVAVAAASGAGERGSERAA